MPIREQQVTNRQHAIPQSIMSVEFKIIGDLTLKQFFFLLIFCGLAYVSFIFVSAFIVKWLLIIFFVGTGLGFAFLPLGDRGLDAWVINFLRAMFLPNQFVYRKNEDVPSVFLYQNLDVLRSELITLTPTSSRRKIEAYLEQQETPVDKLDFDEKNYILKVKEAYSHADYWPTPSSPPAPSTNVTTTVITDEPPAEPQIQPKQAQPDLSRPELPAGHPPSVIQEKPPIQTPQPQVESAQPAQEQIIKSQVSAKAYKPRKEPRVQDSYYSPSITPDMHAGRMFINLSQEAGRGEIVLPIRGERILKSSEEQAFELDEAQKVKELDALINDIRSKELAQRQTVKPAPKEPEAPKAAPIQTPEPREDAAKQQEAMKEQERLARLRQQEELLQKQKADLLAKNEAQKAEPQQIRPSQIPLRPALVDKSPQTPNVIWGQVATINQDNKVAVPGVVVVIRNQRGEVVRAIKTNQNGRFGISTPLVTGNYTIEVDQEKKSGLTFAIAGVEAKGEIIPTVEIIGRM